MDIEVIFPEVCGAFYKAKLLDLNISDGKCLASFENNWKPNTWVELQNVRFPPSPPDVELNLATGAKIEAFLPFKEGEEPGWWTATVTKSKGEVAGILFQLGDRNHADLVEHKFLRNPNENPPLSTLQFNHKEFTVPDDIQEFCRDNRVHENFRSKIKALHVSYDEEKKSLIVTSDSHASLDKAEVLIDIHWSDLATQASLRSRTEKAAQRLQVTQPIQVSTDGVFEEKFHIYPECIGFAMGKQGWNVNQARQLPGIISIDFDDFNSLFVIKAETKEAAEEARTMIEFTREIIYIPRDLAGKVIGRGGNVIQQVLEKSRLNNIKVIGDDEANERTINAKGEVPFELLGRRKAIENAKLMFDYHIDHLREVKTILQSSEELSQKLRSSGINDDMPTYFPRPNPRGWPSGRGGRGRGRGRSGRGRRPAREHNSYDKKDDEEHNSSDDTASTEEDQQQHNDTTQQQNQDSHSGDDTPTTNRRRRRGGRGRRRYDRREENVNGSTNETGTVTTEIQSQDWPAISTDIVQ